MHAALLTVGLFVLSQYLVLSSQIPASVLQKFKSARSHADLLRSFRVVQPQSRNEFGLFNSSASSTAGANLTNVITDATQSNDHCTPQSVCVPVPLLANINDEILHFPICIQLPQCIGTCCDAQHKCHAQAIENVAVLVHRYMFTGIDESTLEVKLDTLEPLLVTMVKHNGCGCHTCRQTIDKCPTERHELIDCACRCKNKGALLLQCTAPHRWNDKTCECVCPLKNCPNNQRLDTFTCSYSCGVRDTWGGQIVPPCEPSTDTDQTVAEGL